MFAMHAGNTGVQGMVQSQAPPAFPAEQKYQMQLVAGLIPSALHVKEVPFEVCRAPLLVHGGQVELVERFPQL